MLFGAFLPLILVVGLGLLVAVIVLVREIRKIIGASGKPSSREPRVSLAGESPPQELSTRYKPHKQRELEKQPRANYSEGNSTGGAIWRW
jgi:hypothetical protein